MNVDCLPPHNRDAERALLGSMLRDNGIIPEIITLVKAEHFYVFAHQKIFEAITKLNDDGDRPADIVTVCEFLTQARLDPHDRDSAGLINEVGGMGYVGDLFDAAPSAAHFRQYAEIIRHKAIVRSLIHACTELQAEALDQTQKPTELLDSAERRILQIAEMGVTGNTVTLQSAIQDAWHRLDQRKQRGAHELSGIPTGFLDLDSLTAGFQNNELIIIAARPSVGKTAFALNIARHVVIDQGLPVLFVSLEQAYIELAERLLCCHGRVDSHRLRKGQLDHEEQTKLMDAGGVLSEAPLFIDDAPGQNMLRIAANARRLKKRHDLRLVIIDYLQLIDPDDRRDSRQEQVAAISRRLKFLARELKLPVIALAQVNRSSEDRADHRPRLSDLRESGAIEQDADMVMMLHRPDYHEPGQDEGLVEVIIAKQRNGPTGSAKLLWVQEHMRFENVAME